MFVSLTLYLVCKSHHFTVKNLHYTCPLTCFLASSFLFWLVRHLHCKNIGWPLQNWPIFTQCKSGIRQNVGWTMKKALRALSHPAMYRCVHLPRRLQRQQTAVNCLEIAGAGSPAPPGNRLLNLLSLPVSCAHAQNDQLCEAERLRMCVARGRLVISLAGHAASP